MNISKTLLASSISALLIVGCGGGGGNSTPTVPISSASTVGGTVSKGIVRQGIVTAYMLSSTGVKQGEAVGNAITADDGTYSLELNDAYDNTSALLLELTSDDTTKMICDATSCGNGSGSTVTKGNPFTPPEDFKLTTIIPAVASTATVSAQITAFTHIAAHNIQNDPNGNISVEKIDAANDKVTALVGTNILTTAPVDISNVGSAEPDQQKYTIMLAALAEQAFENDALLANLDAIVEDFEDGTFGDDTGGLDLSELSTDINTEVASLDATDQASLTSFTTTIAAIAENDEFEPQVSPNNGDGDVAKAKALVTEIRTWGNSLSDLESPADAFTVESDSILETLDQNSKAVIEVLAQAIAEATQAIGNSLEAETTIPTSINILNQSGQVMGALNIVDGSNTNGHEYSISATNVSGVSLSANMKLSALLTSTQIAAGDTSFEVSANASNDESKVTLEDTVVTVTLSEAFTIDSGSGNGSSSNFESSSRAVSNPEEESNPKISAIAFAGGLKVEELSSGNATGKAVNANADIKLVVLNGLQGIDNELNLSLEKLSLTDLSVSSNSGSSSTLSVNLNIDNAVSFDTFGYLDQNSSLRVYEEFNINDIDTSAIKSSFGLASISYLYYSAYSNQTCAQGTSSSGAGFVNYHCKVGDIGSLKSQVESDLNQQYPQSYTSVSLQQLSYSMYDGSRVFVNGALQVGDIETATSFLDATLNVTGTLDLASHPEAVLSITADKTGLKTGSFTAALNYDGKIMSIVANTTNGESDGTSGDITFTGANAEMKLNVAADTEELSGTVTVDGAAVGVIEETSSGIAIIRYNDGTFESL